MSERPIQLVVNVSEEEEGGLWALHDAMREAGIPMEVAFALSDLAVYAERGTVDIALVDLSFPRAVEAVEEIRRTAKTPIRLASMRFWRDVPAAVPAWAERHLVYSSAQQFAAVVADFVRS